MTDNSLDFDKAESRNRFMADMETVLHEHARKLAWVGGWQAAPSREYRLMYAEHSLLDFDHCWGRKRDSHEGA